MTEQQFKSLKKDQEFKCENNVYKAKSIHVNQGVILGTNNIVPIPFRFENCELVVKDELVEYLNNDRSSVEKAANDIRQLVRKEVIDGLKFPTIIEVYGERLNKSNRDFYEWFLNEVKTLNK